MVRKTLSYIVLPLLVLLSNSSGNSAPGTAQTAQGPFVPGPDVVTGDMHDLYRSGFEAPSELGLSIGITSCNRGNATAHFAAMPNTNHPAVAQNFYRMSGGAGNDERFEQIAQSWVKHTYGASASNECGYGCTDPRTHTLLGIGCSDAYLADQSASQQDLGSRAWVNPFTGEFPATARDHTGHAHRATSHMMLVQSNDLMPASNPGATFYAEVQYIVPDEYAWCQAHPGECNMFNNSSYRRYNVTNSLGQPNSFAFSAAANTTQMSAAINAWTGATINPIEPEPGIDGRAFVAWKVTNPSPGVWHYEYALYNMNLDRAIQSFIVPLGCGVTVSNVGFHAPLNHPGFPNDGTQGNAGFSNAAWIPTQTAGALSWNSETFAQNQNANAIRWGTLYNFRFDSNQPPQATNATIGFFKTGSPILVGIQGPTPCVSTPTPTPTPLPPGPSQTVNLSTRMRVQTGDRIGIGGFIITGSTPKHVVVRAIGPSLSQFGTSALQDPVLEVHGPAGFVTITNDNWKDDPAQRALLETEGLAPTNDFESAIDVTLPPGPYTGIVRGKSNSQGFALIEIYDLNPSLSSRLANISTRAHTVAGSDIVIAGFILSNGSDADRIVVRGLGPSLTAFGLSQADVLFNPEMELRDESGTLLSQNNDWQDDPAQAAELTAAGLAPTDRLESGIAMTLPPGAYTALLFGRSAIGIGVVEVYDRGAP